MNNSIKIIVLLLIYFFVSVGCNKFLDSKTPSNPKLSNNYYEFTILDDKNVFRYKSTTYLKRDNEVILPTLFEINLPKNLINFEINNMSEFSFYYSKKQSIFIYNDNERKVVVANDTLFVPNEKELNVFIDNFSKGSFKDNIKNNKIISKRKFCFFKKKNSTILLYNIKPENFNYFLTYVKSLSIQ